LPCSRQRSSPISAARASIASPIATSVRRRSASWRDHSPAKARPAAATAASICAGVASGQRANASPVAGSITSKLCSPATALPSIRCVNVLMCPVSS
jgi:hypothetical protein